MEESTPILMEEAYWRNSQLSVARLYGRIKFNGHEYVVVNKEGKDLWRCTIEAEEEGRTMAIPPGEPADLIRKDFLPLYRKLGRRKFIEILIAEQQLPDLDIKRKMKVHATTKFE